MSGGVPLKTSMSVLRRHARNFIKVVHPDIVSFRNPAYKKQNEVSLGAFNNFMDLTSSVCSPKAQAPKVLDPRFKFSFFVPKGGDHDTIRKIDVSVQVPSAFSTANAVNAMHQRHWVRVAATGVAQLLGGANIPIPDDLDALCRRPQPGRGKAFPRGGKTRKKNRAVYGSFDSAEIETAMMDHIYKHGVDNDLYYNLHGEAERSRREFSAEFREETILGLVRGRCLFLSEELSDAEAAETVEQFVAFLDKHFVELSLDDELWATAAVIVRKEEGNVGKLLPRQVVLPYSKRWGQSELSLLKGHLGRLWKKKTHRRFGRHSSKKR